MPEARGARGQRCQRPRCQRPRCQRCQRPEVPEAEVPEVPDFFNPAWHHEHHEVRSRSMASYTVGNELLRSIEV